MQKKTWGIAPIALALALGITGCSYAGAAVDAVEKMTSDPQGEPNAVDAQATGSITAYSHYGDIVASGKPVVLDGGSYDRLSIEPHSDFSLETMTAVTEAGWTEAESRAGLDLALKYVVEEVLDSQALEGGSGSYKKWHEETAKKYFAAEVLQDEGLRTGKSAAILGSGDFPMPALIHDGSPRQKSAKVELSGHGPYDGEGVHGIEYGFDFTAEYRVGDEAAAEFATRHLDEEMTREEFLGSVTTGNAEDGGLENLYRASGYLYVVVQEGKDGLEIIGLGIEPEFSLSRN